MGMPLPLHTFHLPWKGLMSPICQASNPHTIPSPANKDELSNTKALHTPLDQGPQPQQLPRA